MPENLMGGVCDQHVELARAGVELLNADRSYDPAVQPGHGIWPDAIRMPRLEKPDAT